TTAGRRWSSFQTAASEFRKRIYPGYLIDFTVRSGRGTCIRKGADSDFRSADGSFWPITEKLKWKASRAGGAPLPYGFRSLPDQEVFIFTSMSSDLLRIGFP